jgi:hypothetical protein
MYSKNQLFLLYSWQGLERYQHNLSWSQSVFLLFMSDSSILSNSSTLTSMSLTSIPADQERRLQGSHSNSGAGMAHRYG